MKDLYSSLELFGGLSMTWIVNKKVFCSDIDIENLRGKYMLQGRLKSRAI